MQSTHISSSSRPASLALPKTVRVTPTARGATPARVAPAPAGGDDVPSTSSSSSRLHGLAATAALAAALVIAAPARAGVEETFANSCAGCHAGGGNVVRREATLSLPDLERNGVATLDDVYAIIYSGRRSMPGFGADCAPKLQCTFAPRLSDDAIRELSQYVLDKASSGW